MGSPQNGDEGSNRGAVPGSLCQPERTHSAPAPLLSPCSSSGLQGVMDSEGRVDESRLRAYIFKQGGVLPGDRRLVWGFLFGMYPCSSTALERAALSEELGVRYQTMKRKWQRELPGAVRMRLNGTDEELIAAVKLFERSRLEAEESDAEESEEAREKQVFLKLQAQVLIDRVQLDIEELQEAVRIIDKDVPRTERDLDYFLYTQGMNELCSRFLEVLDSERDSYWCFSSYMEKIADDFKADGLRRKIELEVKLLQELDPELHAHLFPLKNAFPLVGSRLVLLTYDSDTHGCFFFSRFSLQGTLDLNAMLQKAEELFIKYCKKSVLDCFKNHCLQPKDREPFSFPLRSFFS
ncbi:UNVERIFIED_CONTAM: hypothetical protein FKN15_009392 [Acipenser sinensis]